MAKVITFSRTFPAYHPKAGQPTGFAFKIWNSLPLRPWELADYMEAYKKAHPWRDSEFVQWRQSQPKYHTIRSGHRWKAGDKFSPRVWSGKPDHSKMITIAPDIEIVKVWSFEIADNKFFIDNNEISAAQWMVLAKNDGLTVPEMLDWFKYPVEFSGQILCWSKDITY